MAAPCTTIFALVLSVIYFVCITSHPARENSVRLKVRQAQALKIFFSFHVHTTSTESYGLNLFEEPRVRRLRDTNIKMHLFLFSELVNQAEIMVFF